MKFAIMVALLLSFSLLLAYGCIGEGTIKPQPKPNPDDDTPPPPPGGLDGRDVVVVQGGSDDSPPLPPPN